MNGETKDPKKKTVVSESGKEELENFEVETVVRKE